MPIGIDRFEDADDLGEPTTGERILQFLFAHDDHAYTRREIADAIDVNPETVGTNLTRLKERDLVRHREPYWALTDDRERAIGALGGDDGTTTDEFHGDEGENEQEDESEIEEEWTALRVDRSHREAATAFFERVHDNLDDAIEALYLFGSVARDSETAESDVDVLAVIADDANYATVDDQLLDIAYDIQLEYDVPVEVHAIRASEFAAREDRGEPFVRTVVEEGEFDA